MATKPPLVSVLMPVYNSAKYLDDAISSILNQTHEDFEFLIIDDGSTDDSPDIVKKRNDKRIRLIVNQHQGLVPVLNQGITLARGQYLARMDSDDISLPTRFEKQVQFLNDHPEIGICGTAYKTFGENAGERIFTRPTSPEADKAMMLFGDPIHHPTVMIRTEPLIRFHLRYDASYRHLEDHEFWNRCSRYFDFANLPEVLFLYRLHNKQVGHLYKQEQTRQLKRIQKTCLEDLGIKPLEKDIKLQWEITTRHHPQTKEFLSRTYSWLQKLVDANDQSHLYDPIAFRAEIGKRWAIACYDCNSLGLWALYQYLRSHLRTSTPATPLITFSLRCLFNQVFGQFHSTSGDGKFPTSHPPSH